MTANWKIMCDGIWTAQIPKKDGICIKWYGIKRIYKMPFKSKAQQRFMFAKHPGIAKEFAEETSNIKKLPEHVSSKKSTIKTKDSTMKEHDKKEHHKKEHHAEHADHKHMHKHHNEMKKHHEKELKHHEKMMGHHHKHLKKK
jgi:hypothetical protein